MGRRNESVYFFFLLRAPVRVSFYRAYSPRGERETTRNFAIQNRSSRNRTRRGERGTNRVSFPFRRGWTNKFEYFFLIWILNFSLKILEIRLRGRFTDSRGSQGSHRWPWKHRFKFPRSTYTPSKPFRSLRALFARVEIRGTDQAVLFREHPVYTHTWNHVSSYTGTKRQKQVRKLWPARNARREAVLLVSFFFWKFSILEGWGVGRTPWSIEI